MVNLALSRWEAEYLRELVMIDSVAINSIRVQEKYDIPKEILKEKLDLCLKSS